MSNDHAKLLIFLCLFLNFLDSAFPTPTNQSSNSRQSISSTEFSRFSELDPAGAFKLFWKFDEETITFQVHAATKGWAGIGFSPNGGMAGADIVIFWMDGSGKGVISDRYATENGFPKEDAQQDYMLIAATKNDTHMTATFSRKRITCDKQDWPLTDGTTRVIYASNNAAPESRDSFRKHTVRGSKSLFLFDEKASEEKALPEKDAKAIELRVNKVHIPDNVTTTYWCEVVPIPKFTKKMHIIKIDPIIERQNIDIVHHIIVYTCTQDMSEWVGKGRSCFKGDTEEEDPALIGCKQAPMAGWAVGGQSTRYPDNVGYPLYADAGATFVMLEMHYENSDLKKGKIDSSGMRIWVTEALRPIDAGQAMVAIEVGAAEQVIPPGQKEFTSYGYCSAECTAGFPKDGIKVFGGLLHTHLAGRKVRLLHFRNGKELPPIIADEHYDFNYQDGRTLKEHNVILPGDELVVECVYETLDRTKTTFSGYSTRDEMCEVYLDYYPAVYRGFMCTSSPNKRELYKPFGIDVLPYRDSDADDDTQEIVMVNGKKIELSKYLKTDFKFDWTQQKIDQLQKNFRDVNHTVICVRQDLNEPELKYKLNAESESDGVDFFQQNGFPKADRLVTPDVCTDKMGIDASNPGQNRSDRNKTSTSSRSPRLRERNAGQRAAFGLGFVVISMLIVVFGN